MAKLTSEDILADAAKKAAQYDYDAAIAAIEADETTAQSEAGQAAITKYNEIKGTLVRQDPQKITHVFFHTLIMDNKKAFDGDSRQNGYNDVMTTKSEFEKMMQSMYDKGYVLVRIHDVAYEVDDPETGGKKMVWGDIMLPPGKTAFVLSQDDVNYYE
ncbi:MAG: polysaccharide deacetylase, partial [Segatella maculosa]